MVQPLLRVTEVSKSFGKVVAVNQVSLDVEAGELVSLLGPSGCGKTTTLRTIAGLERPDSGRIMLAGEDITDRPPEKRNLAMMFQDYALFPHMTVEANVAFGLEMKKIPKPEIQKRVAEALELVRLSGLEKRRPKQLSGGQQQRVALARALVVRPQVALLDEPLSNLDAKLRKEMRMELKLLQRKLGITMVYVTHDQEEALTLSDRIAVMREGCCVQIGNPFEIYENPKDSFVASFFGQENFFRGRAAISNSRELQVEASEGLVIRAMPNPDIVHHSQVTLVVKKERIKIISPDAPLPEELRVKDEINDFLAQVEFVAYLGTTIQYACSLRGQQLLVDVQNESGTPLFRRGDTVRLVWDAKDCISVG